MLHSRYEQVEYRIIELEGRSIEIIHDEKEKKQYSEEKCAKLQSHVDIIKGIKIYITEVWEREVSERFKGVFEKVISQNNTNVMNIMIYIQ